MGRNADTHIRVTETNWTRLNRLKRPGESFNDVIGRLLDQADGPQDATETNGGQQVLAPTSD
jgi:predicted CopG family antitoxin